MGPKSLKEVSKRFLKVSKFAQLLESERRKGVVLIRGLFAKISSRGFVVCLVLVVSSEYWNLSSILKGVVSNFHLVGLVLSGVNITNHALPKLGNRKST